MLKILQKLFGFNHPDPHELALEQLTQLQAGMCEAPEQAPPQQTQRDTPDGTIGEVAFQLTTNGDLNIKVRWDDSEFRDGRSEIFGEFCYHICNGTFEDNLKQVVIQIASEEVSHRTFIKKALEKWQQLKKNKADFDDKPAINPLEVFNLTKRPGLGGEE